MEKSPVIVLSVSWEKKSVVDGRKMLCNSHCKQNILIFESTQSKRQAFNLKCEEYASLVSKMFNFVHLPHVTWPIGLLEKNRHT